MKHDFSDKLKAILKRMYKKDRRKYLTLAEASQLCRYSAKYLNLLVRQGKLEAYKEGRNWMTTKEAIEKYIKERKRERK